MSAPWTPSQTNVTYSPGVGLGTVAVTERCNVFLPDGTAPAAGWPVLLWIEDTALTGSAPSRQTTIAKGGSIGHQCLARGIAFVSATVARVDSGASGGGLFTQPGSGAWDSATQLNAWKSTVHLIQWARVTATFDPANILVGGELIGADLALWAGAGPAVASSAQFRAGVSHRANGVIALRPCGWFPGVQITQPGGIFSEAGVPGTAAVELGDADSTDLLQASPLWAMFNGSTERTANASLPVFTWASGPVGATSFEFSANLPTLSNTLPSTGDAWGSHALRRALVGLAYQFHTRRSTGLHAARYQDGTGYATEVLADDADVYARAGQWALGAIGQAPPQEPVAERVLRNLTASLLSAQEGAAYWHTVYDVKRGPSFEALTTSTTPTVWVTGLGTEAQGPGRDQTATNSRTLLAFVEGWFLAAGEDAPTRIQRLGHDLERAILADHTLCGIALDTLVTNVEITIPPTGQQQSFGVSLTVEVKYRTVSTDLLVST